MCNKIGCFWAIIVGIALGIAAAVLFALLLIPFISITEWIILALSVGVLTVLTVLIVIASIIHVPALRTCLHHLGLCTLLSSALSVVFAMIALSTLLTPLLIFTILLVFLSVTTFSIMAIAYTLLLYCLLKKPCRPECD